MNFSMNAYINFSVNVYIPSNMERAFRQTLISAKQLWPDASKFWLLLFIWAKQNASGRERLLWIKKEYSQRSPWGENDLINCFSFIFSSFCSVSSSFLFNIWLRSKISWVEKLRNNGLKCQLKKILLRNTKGYRGAKITVFSVV